MMIVEHKRQSTLETIAVAAGEAWFSWWCDELNKQGRPMAGGWPGTLSEARARILARVSKELGPAWSLSEAELAALAQTAFVTARAGWIARAVPDSDPE